MSDLAILRIGRDGRVAGRSDAAVRMLGRVLGRPCHRVVGALGPGGQALCREGCVGELFDGSLDSTSEPQARLAGSPCHLECRKVGAEVVVVVSPTQGSNPGRAHRLSPREQQILGLVGKGLTRDQIAQRLELQPCTVRTHLEHARAKLGARTSAQAVATWLTAQATPTA